MKKPLLKTRTYTYLLPGLAYNVSINKELLVDVFLGDIENLKAPSERLIYCLFKFDENQTEYEESLMNHSLFVEHYDVDEEHFMCIFKYPEEFYDDYDKFINSQMGSFSLKFRGIIVKYHSLVKSSNVYCVLHKTPLYRKQLEYKIGVELPEDADLAEALNIKNEMYTNKKDTP